MTQPPGGIPAIDVAEAAARLEAEPGGGGGAAPVLVDVRELGEFLDVRAEGAVLMPMSQLAERHGELPKDRPLLVICASGGRSAAATGFLLRSGWTDVVNVEGGTTAWAKAGLPVRRGEIAPGEGELST
jgi:rhodanese-related sulfurtransferase